MYLDLSSLCTQSIRSLLQSVLTHSNKSAKGNTIQTMIIIWNGRNWVGSWRRAMPRMYYHRRFVLVATISYSREIVGFSFIYYYHLKSNREAYSDHPVVGCSASKENTIVSCDNADMCSKWINRDQPLPYVEAGLLNSNFI